MNDSKDSHVEASSVHKYQNPIPVGHQDPPQKWWQPRSLRSLVNLVAVIILIAWTGSQLFHFTELMASGLSSPESQPILIKNLPSNYIPQIGKNRLFRRLLVVGDVHGMKKSLLNLLNEINYDKHHDHLILAGDMVSKGPDSPGVVDLAIELGATCVRGNHEDSVILAWEEMRAKNQFFNTESIGFIRSGEHHRDFSPKSKHGHQKYHSSKEDRNLVKDLGESRMNWLKKCPVILRVGDLKGMGEVVVVHAGLQPGLALEEQNPKMVMNMRSLKHGIPHKDHGKTWTKPWNDYQKSLLKSERQTVLYGHDAKRGLNIKKYSMGLDSGCVKGGKLTAAVIQGGDSHQTFELAHVKCPSGIQ